MKTTNLWTVKCYRANDVLPPLTGSFDSREEAVKYAEWVLNWYAPPAIKRVEIELVTTMTYFEETS